MRQKAKFVTIIPLILLGAVSASAQVQTSEKTFNLAPPGAVRDTTKTEGKTSGPEFKPHLERGKFEVSLTLGFLDLNSTLLAHDQVIYKFNNEATFWGDVDLVGESAFNPTVHLGYNLTNWFALEPSFGLSVSEYLASITNRHRRPNELDAVVDPLEPPLGDFDAEHRSVMTISAGLHGLVYPLDVGGDGAGRFHPFLTGGLDRFWMNLNSSYTDDPSISWSYCGGGGFRLIADDLISIRFEVLYHTTTTQFSPSQVFDSLDEGTRLIPVYEYKPLAGQEGFREQRVQEYASQTISSLSWGLGFFASF